jgi:hypothetical protein
MKKFSEIGVRDRRTTPAQFEKGARTVRCAHNLPRDFIFGEHTKNKSRAPGENSLASRDSVATVPPR